MAENETPKSTSISTKTLLGKGGPIAGSVISIIGSMLILIGFILPWASCSGYNMSGFEIASQSMDSGETSAVWLYLVPFFAVGTLGVALLVIPITIWKKIPSAIKSLATLLVCLLAAFACCPACVFLYQVQSAGSSSSTYGVSFIKVEYGFWISMFGIFVAFLGGLLGAGTALTDLLTRKKTSEPPPKKT